MPFRSYTRWNSKIRIAGVTVAALRLWQMIVILFHGFVSRNQVRGIGEDMPQYEGFVTKTGRKGEAEVVIQPENARIIGASNLKVCHSASESSSICVKAENSVGAEVGDRVRIRRDGGALIKNAAALVGIPIMGLLVGLSASVILRHPLNISVSGQLFMACAGLLLGLFLGVFLYRRISGDPRLMIIQVIQGGSFTQSLTGEGLPCFQSGTSACEGCVGGRAGD